MPGRRDPRLLLIQRSATRGVKETWLAVYAACAPNLREALAGG
jgi:hypothetical protein